MAQFYDISRDILIEDNQCEFDSLDKCTICNEYYPLPNEIYCSTCSLIKCIMCTNYYALPNQEYCAECILHKSYANKTWTIKEILDLPTSSFKGSKMNEHLEEIFEYFRLGSGMRNKLLKNKQLLELCKNKTSGQIVCILDGQTNFPPVLLPANYADLLLSQVLADNQANQYKYIHAICPFVYDLWNIKTNNNVLKCYHTHFGELIKCPNSFTELTDLWSRSIRQYLIEGVSNETLSYCSHCNVDVMLQSKNKLKCKSCYKYYHYFCFNYFTKCPNCDSAWNINKISDYDYSTVWIV